MAEIEKPDYVANRIEAVVASMLDSYMNTKVLRFTPSIQEGVRYIGFTTDSGKALFIEIKVTEAE